MRRNHQTSYDTLPRNSSSNNRSRSQNHYFIQANQFQKRYQNSLFNAYKLNTSRSKCPPCCNSNGVEREFQSQMTFCQKDQGKYRGNMESYNDYYENSYMKNNSYNQQNNQTMINLQNSKRYLQDLLQKSKQNFKIQTQKAQNQILCLQKLLQQKTQQISQLNKQITRLKKISIQAVPNSKIYEQQSYIKQDQALQSQIQNKQQTIKQLERKAYRLRQQNSYFRQDLLIKNKQIQQLKSKYKLKQESDIKIKQQLQNQIALLKQEKKNLLQKIIILEKIKDQDQKQIEAEVERRRLLESELNQYRVKYNEIRSISEQNTAKTNQKYKLLQKQIRIVKQKNMEKDTKIQQLLSRITCIQSQIDFFKDKFTNLLMQIQRQERQSAIIYQKAQSMRQNGQRLYEQIQKIRQSQIIELQSHRASKINNNHNLFDQMEYRMFESHVYNNKDNTNRKGLGRQNIFETLNNYNSNKQDYMIQSTDNFIHKFPSLNMSISPIRYKQ